MGAGLGVPILLTQHLPPSFMPYFAMQLGRMTPMRVKVAEEAHTLLANHIYIAPGEANLTCRPRSGGGQSAEGPHLRAIVEHILNLRRVSEYAAFPIDLARTHFPADPERDAC